MDQSMVSSGSAEAGDQRATGIQVIARAGAILRVLGRSDRGLTLRSVATATGLPRSTVHRIVVALAAENLVVWDPTRGRAELGMGLVSLALSRRHRLRDMVRPQLEALARRVDETVDLVVLRGGTVVFVDQIIAHQILVVSAMGAALPAHCTAGGKALLAALRRGEVERLLPQELERFTPHTIADRDELIEQLAVVQISRLAYDREEHTVGVSAVGAVVRNAWGEVAAVTIPVPSQRFAGREEELSVALLETCDELDDALSRD
jgi:DNA-binding IclR family transcriptional regulator